MIKNRNLAHGIAEHTVVQESGLESIQGADVIDLLQQIFQEIGGVEIKVISEMDVGL